MEDINFYRIFAAFFTGYFLHQTGFYSQSISSNELSSPSTFGIDGLILLILIIINLLSQFWEPLMIINQGELSSSLPFLFTILVSFIMAFLFKNRMTKYFDSKNIIFIGMAVNLLIGALLSACHFVFLAFNFSFPSELFFGHFKWVGKWEVFICFIFFLINLIFRKKYLPYIVLANIEQQLVINKHHQKMSGQLMILMWILVLTSLIYSYFGSFAFLSLILPHLVNKFPYLNSHFKIQLMLGPWFCGLIILLLDQICYFYPLWGMELPTGMLTNIIASFFMILLLVNANKSIKDQRAFGKI